MTDTFRELCAELVNHLQGRKDLECGWPGEDPEQDLLDRARAALAQSEPEGPSPKEVDAREAFTQLRDEILHLLGSLEVNEVLGIIDYYTPEWV